MIVLSWRSLIANWKRTTKLLCQHFRWQCYMSDPFYSCIKLRLNCAEHNLQLNDLCKKTPDWFLVSVLSFYLLTIFSWICHQGSLGPTGAGLGPLLYFLIRAPAGPHGQSRTKGLYSWNCLIEERPFSTHFTTLQF